MKYLALLLLIAVSLPVLHVPAPVVASSPSSTAVSSYVVWYDDPSPLLLAASQYDLVIVDPDYGSRGEPWTIEDLHRIAESGKKLVAYLSVGEAEEWRDYWNSSWYENPPEWLGPENPEWPGCYRVKYWYPEWKQILKDEVDKIAGLGFEGLLLDTVDTCEFWEEQGVENATEEMVDLVIELSSYAGALMEHPLIIPNLGGKVEIVEYRGFMDAISGAMREDVFYSDDQLVDPSETQYVVSYLEQVVQAGKFVLILDYLWTEENVEDFYQKCEQHGFVGYPAPSRDLDRMAPDAELFYGLELLRAGNAYVLTWCYSGFVEQLSKETKGSDVLCGELSGDGILQKLSLVVSEPGWQGRVSAALTAGGDELLIAWESSETEESNETDVVGGVANASTLSLELSFEVSVDPGAQLSPSIGYQSEALVIAYVDESSYNDTLADVKAAFYDRNLNLLKRVVVCNTTSDERYPAVASSPASFVILWYSNDSRSLMASCYDLNGSFLWSADLGTAWPSCYSATYSHLLQGFLVVERISSAESKLLLISEEGSPELLLEGLPPIAFESELAILDGESKALVAYVSPSSLVIVEVPKDGVPFYAEVRLSKALSTTGTDLAFLAEDAVMIATCRGAGGTPTLLVVSLAGTTTTAPATHSAPPSALNPVFALIAVVAALARGKIGHPRRSSRTS